MKTLLILIVMVAVFYILWTLWDSLIKNKIKNKQHSIFDQHQKEISKMQQDEDDLPEKSKQIKQHLDQERLNIAITKQQAQDQQNGLAQSVVIDDVNQEDQRLFDDAAQLFFQQGLKVTDLNQAGGIQQNLLSKMPLSTQSQSGSFDFGEWAIYWHYHDQSLEYYVGRYGIFYAHVDHEGREHKLEFRHSTL